MTKKTLIAISMALWISGCGNKERNPDGTIKHTGGTSTSSSKTSTKAVLTFSAIPDQNSTNLKQKFDRIATYLSEKLGIEVIYKASISYTASVEEFRNGNTQLAWFGGFTVVAVDYRLAPEHHFPAAVSDAKAAYRSLLEEAGRLGLDKDRLAVGGDSAGANLATVVCEVMRGERNAPVYQLLVYPVTDVSREHDSYQLFPDHYLLTSEAMRWFIGHYVKNEEERLDPREAAALVAQACEGLGYAHK